MVLYLQRLIFRYYNINLFRTALTGKLIIASPPNKDRCTTYHQGEVSIP